MVRSLPTKCLGFVGGAQIGLGDDFHQRHAGAIEVDERHRGMLVVQQLAGVLLEVKPLDADPRRLAVRHVDHNLAFADDRRFVLADLVALRQIRIEVVLAVEHRLEVDLGLQPEPGAHRLAHAFLVDHRQHAGHGGIDERHMRVRLAAERGRCAGKQLGLRGHLGMHFHADDHFPVAGCALDQLRFRYRCVHCGFAVRPLRFRYAASWARGKRRGSNRPSSQPLPAQRLPPCCSMNVAKAASCWRINPIVC